ncbi:MAG: acetylglutamate kinase [Saprospiraceae bacterium]
MQLKVLKIGGNVLEGGQSPGAFLEVFAGLPGPKVLVHGGGVKATELARQLGVETKMVDGRRITSREMLGVVTMVYSGLNKELTARLQRRGTKAVGLCGADLGILPAVKRNHPEIDYGYAGDILEANIRADVLMDLLKQDITPVFAPLTFDAANGTLLNTNADTVARSLAVALSKHCEVELIFCFEKPGVLMEVDNPASVIPEITPENFRELTGQKIIVNGMIPKLHNAFEAIGKGVGSVRITHFTQPNGGTLITA